MISDKLKKLCHINNTSLTDLCKEITGSTGCLSDWKKGKIYPDSLRAICLKFKVSSDFILELPQTIKHDGKLPYKQELLCNYGKLDNQGVHRVHTVIYEELDRIKHNMKKTATGLLKGKQMSPT